MGARFDITQIKNPKVREQALRLAAAARSDTGIRTPDLPLPHTPAPPVSANGSRIPRAPQPNKTESEFNRIYLASSGLYEAITFRLAGGSRYTPDWYALVEGQHTVIETKGAYRHHSYGRALTAWREARAQFPGFCFVWAVRGADGAWKVEGWPVCNDTTIGRGVEVLPRVDPPAGAEAGYFSRVSTLRKGSDARDA